METMVRLRTPLPISTTWLGNLCGTTCTSTFVSDMQPGDDSSFKRPRGNRSTWLVVLTPNSVANALSIIVISVPVSKLNRHGLPLTEPLNQRRPPSITKLIVPSIVPGVDGTSILAVTSIAG
jgi:hypothetical protein